MIGDPIAHSLSPYMHNAAFRALGINAVYEAVRIKADELAKFAEDAKKKYDGFNVTVPHKNKIIDFLDGVYPIANFAGSVNTVINENALLWGDSTDGRGLELAIQNEFGLSISQKNVFFIGCGGASRAVAVHFAASGVKSLSFINRTLSKAEELFALLKKESPNVKISFSSINDENFIENAVEEADIIIQSTSLGLDKSAPSPLSEKFFLQNKFYYDMIYGKTKFIELARKHNCQAADGLSMLLYQGVESFKKWTGLDAPIEIMRNALLEKKG